AVRSFVLPKMEARAPIRAWIVDDTGIPKKGKHSVGVARQYCGELGKQNNCQVAVTLSVASDQASLPIAGRLYSPEAWANDKARRTKAGVPSEITFETKPQIALSQIRRAIADGVPKGVGNVVLRPRSAPGDTTKPRLSGPIEASRSEQCRENHSPRPIASSRSAQVGGPRSPTSLASVICCREKDVTDCVAASSCLSGPFS